MRLLRRSFDGGDATRSVQAEVQEAKRWRAKT